MAKYGNWVGEGEEHADETDKRPYRVTIEAINEDGTTEQLWKKEGESLMVMLHKGEEGDWLAQCALLNVTDKQMASAFIENEELAGVRKMIAMYELLASAGMDKQTKH